MNAECWNSRTEDKGKNIWTNSRTEDKAKIVQEKQTTWMNQLNAECNEKHEL